MSRPMPVLPRLTRLRKRRAADVLLGCPRISPQWELHAIQALIKPQLREPIEHKSGEQRWPRGAGARVDDVWRSFSSRAGLHNFESPLHMSPAGEFHAIATFSARDEPIARGFAIALSIATPTLWWVVGRLFVKDGQFFRRERGVKLKLVLAKNVHLTRDMRLAVRRTTKGAES